MTQQKRECPDCSAWPRLPAAVASKIESAASRWDRRTFLRASGVLAAGGLLSQATPLWAEPAATAGSGTSESLVKVLYDKLTAGQRQAVCYPWDHMHPEWGLLRTRVANNWNINDKGINSEFYTDEQRDLVRQIFEGLVQPDWKDKFYKQLEDDAGGFGEDQSFAIFGEPGGEKFQFVMTGRHMTIRCDGNSSEHVAFGGPIFYGHAADGFNEGPSHPGNVFWPQAVEANKVFAMLDGRQRKLALAPGLPREQDSGFRASGRPGIPVTELSADQKQQLQVTLQKLIEPYRQTDRDEVMACLSAQGGLDGCQLAFFQGGDIGNDQVWDCWRLEGPAFVWYFRGAPHVHVWVNVADDPSVPLNA